jgi:hypothetical protein
MKSYSEFGSRIYIDERVKNIPKKIKAFSLRETYFNWDIDSICARIELISYSINNIISLSKGIYTEDFKKEEFLIPDSMSTFQDALNNKNEIHTFDFDVTYDYNDFHELKFPDIDSYYGKKIAILPKK